MRGPGSLRSRAATAVTVLLLAGVAIVLTNVFPFRQILAQQEQVELAEQQLGTLEAENRRLAATAEYLATDQGVEKIAREDFGYVRPGEVAYVVVSPREAPAETAQPEVQSVVELDRTWWQGMWDWLTGRDLLR